MLSLLEARQRIIAPQTQQQPQQQQQQQPQQQQQQHSEIIIRVISNVNDSSLNVDSEYASLRGTYYNISSIHRNIFLFKLKQASATNKIMSWKSHYGDNSVEYVCTECLFKNVMNTDDGTATYYTCILCQNCGCVLCNLKTELEYVMM